MWIPLKAIIVNRPRKDGTYQIYFQYCYSPTKRTVIGSGIAVPMQYWNKKRQFINNSLPENYGRAEMLNDELARMRKVIEGIVDYCKRNSIENICGFLKQTFTPQFKLESLSHESTVVIAVNKEPDLFEELDLYKKAKEKKIVSTGVITALQERLLQFQQFSKKRITFSGLDYNFYVEFVDFLTYDYIQRRRKTIEYGLKLSTVGSTIKNLRVFVNDRKKRKRIPPIDMSDFKILDEESDAVYLTYEEIAQIYRLDLTDHAHLNDDRDLFVLGCLTGLRFSDYSSLKFSDYRNSMLYKKTDKQDNWVIIPMRKEAKEVFIRQFKGRQLKVSNTIFNRNIKEIATLAGITQQITFSYKKGNKDIVISRPKALWVTSHTCRRSFATNEYLMGTDINLIMKITGHKTYKDFFKYIRISQEEAARRIQEVWQGRSDMQAFPAA